MDTLSNNNPFERKRQIYGASHLELNRALAGQDAWARDQILARADELADHAIAIWPSPLPGVSEHPGGFDWSRVDAAIAAIPYGRWTSYGELAQLGGTAAMPVGQHIASTPSLGNAYRVLGSDGRPRPDFHWNTPGDVRTWPTFSSRTVTCRYPLPGPDRFLAEIPVPALSAAELRRMFLRLPALADLDPGDQRLLIRAIGGHPG